MSLEMKEVEMNNRLVHLVNVPNINEANILMGLLENYNIKGILKHKESGEYLQIATGFTFHGVDIYVLEEDIKQAKEIIGINSDQESSMDEEDLELELLEKKFTETKRKKAYVMAILGIGLPICFILIYLIVNLL